MPTLADRLRGKKTGLALASGFFGFYHHAGVLQALHERGIEPAMITGVSAGALVGAMYASGLSPAETGEALLEVSRKDFWDMQWPLGRKGFGLLSGDAFGARLSSVLPNHGFEQCTVPLVVSAYDIATGRVKYLDSGPLIPAVRASCAVPYLFAPVSIDGRDYWDGGFAEKTALVPFLEKPEVEAVLISHMPSREERRKNSTNGALSRLPSLTSFFADTPPDERLERNRQGELLLSKHGVEVITLAPERIWLGPFSMHMAAEAMKRGREGAAALLDAEG